MKNFFIFVALFSLGNTHNEIIKGAANSISLESKSNTHKFLEELFHDKHEIRAGQITTVINEYSDQVFKNVQKYIIRKGLDPVEMPDENIKLFPNGMINLTKGWLEDTSTISRYNNVVVTYRSSTKKLSVDVPIKFDSLLFIYKYHTVALFLNAFGDIQGKMTSVKANICLGFDFENYVVSLEKLDITDTGRISLDFSGNGMVDWVTSTLSNIVSVFLHPVITRVIQSMIKGGLDKTFTLINEILKNILKNDLGIKNIENLKLIK